MADAPPPSPSSCSSLPAASLAGASAEPPRYCRGCGYDLRALPPRPEPRCPECGRFFDPADPRSTLRRPRRRWTRWLWRAGYGLLALLLLLAVVWGWLYWGWYQEQQALLRLRVTGHEERPLAPWLRQRLGSPGFVLDRVYYVYLGPDTDPGELGALARLTRLEGLRLYRTPVRDLRPLAKHPQLRTLWLEGTPVPNLQPLGDMPKLEELDILIPASLDVMPLARCKSLRWLWLPQPTATEMEREALQRALPNCKVVR